MPALPGPDPACHGPSESWEPGVLSTWKVLVRAEMEWLGAESNTCLVDLSGK